MTEPLVSILISVYNAGEYLRPSVESILSQTYSNLEILIIDDGTTDGCMGFIADLTDPRIRVISQKNCGKAVALNRALKELSGEFYAIHDADDVSHPLRIERQVQCMLEKPQVVAVFTGHDLIIDGSQTAPRIAAKNIEQCRRDIEQMRMPAHDPTGMFRVSMVRNIRYEPSLKIGIGIDHVLRVGELYPMMVLGDCLYSYRVHFDSMTRHDPAQRKQMVREVLRRACERREYDSAKSLAPPEPTTLAKFRYRDQETGIVPHFMESVLDLRRAGRKWQAMKTTLTCLQLHPYDPYYYKPLAYFLAPLALIKYYRSTKAQLGWFRGFRRR